jgi:hypothetical protein
LHNVLKDRAGLVKVVTLPSGEQIKDYDSISFHKMTEPERARPKATARPPKAGTPNEDIRQIPRRSEKAIHASA